MREWLDFRIASHLLPSVVFPEFFIGHSLVRGRPLDDQTTVRAGLSRMGYSISHPLLTKVGVGKPEFAVQKRYATPN